ncbi:ribosome silencing factor [Helicobacter sp. 13S00482-2]|uniref:ribosome silencing factor n=1 Tax=Helicobacter sp. 13S00482-2 TaxID=1476200 RepID=UPI000BD8EAAC|nr:ribosome silencing factor [Helicobacter sp. 13S00482-2]PAF53868.1 ribosome silencing factor [Helicobacter sp. 13S00482-2]
MTQTKNLSKRTKIITELLDQKKAENIDIFDLEGKDYIVDCVIIATAMAGKHSYALLDMLKTELKSLGEVFYSTDEESEDWIIADLGDIMIHIFTENHRKKFNLEEFLTKIKKQESLQI